ncbi:MAG TPA: PDZ domain-containing protein [Candidatus Limnocylindrales bacterium]|nr:PDZ domain-containing protein [Candidatus Limnocylindrales bacterium]
MRVFGVVLGVLYALAYAVPTVFVLNGVYGSIGTVKAGAMGVLPAGADVDTVGRVVPGTPAARAGIVPGDIVVKADAQNAPAYAQLFDRAVAGRATDYAVTHEGRRRIVSLTPAATRPSPIDAALIVVQLARGLVIVGIGALLLLLRPSIMTAAFFALCLMFGELAHPANNLELLAAAPLFWKPFLLLLTGIVTGSGPAAAAVFCMRFPTGAPLPSWRRLERAIVAIAIVTIADYVAAIVAGGTFTHTGRRLYAVFTVSSWLCYAVAAAAFMVRYARASGEDRARLRWVAIGLGSFVVSYALFWASENVASAPPRLATYAQFLNVLPFAVAYAIVRHRVLDVRVAGGRAIAFAVLSAIPVTAFSLLDWALGNRLQQSRIALVAEVCVAIGFGFWVNALQRRIDGLIESVFFHARRVAQQRLFAAARRIQYASERGAVDDLLVREPYEALALTSAALFRRAERAFVRVAQRSPSHETLAFIGENDPLVLEILATRAPVPAGAHGLAFPLLVRHDAVGILIVGERTDGERFDALDRAAVETLAGAAAATYEHLDAVESERAADELRRALEESRRENALLRDCLARGGSEV